MQRCASVGAERGPELDLDADRCGRIEDAVPSHESAACSGCQREDERPQAPVPAPPLDASPDPALPAGRRGVAPGRRGALGHVGHRSGEATARALQPPAGPGVVLVSGPSSEGCPGGRRLQSAGPGGRAQPRDSAWRPGGDRPPWRSRAAGRAVLCCMPPARTTLWRVMEQRPLGKSGLNVSRMGLGCMGMSEFYGPADEAESRATLEMAVDRGVNFLDTADMYGAGKNEELVGRAHPRRRDGVVLATKFGIVRDPATDRRQRGDQRQAGLRAQRVRGQPPAAGRRRDRPVLPAPRGPRDAHRGDGGRDGRAGEGGQGPRTSGLSEASAETLRRAREGASHRRAAERVLAVDAATPRTASLAGLPRAGHRLRGLQPAGARLPDRAAPDARATSRPTTSAATTRASRARTSRRTSRWWRRSGALARAEGMHARRSSRSRG